MMNLFSDLTFFTILGILFGSFSNVLIIRIPEAKSVVFPPSSCPSCNNKLKSWHNIPIISYIFLKGKCAFCKCKISPIYPIIEILNGIIFAVIFIKIGDFYSAIILSIIFSLLLSLSIIDLKYKAVPDQLSLLALALSVIYSFDILDNLKYALLFMGGFTALRFYVSYFIKQEAMGEADIIIAGIIGALLQIKLGIFAVFLSSFIALPTFLIVGKKYELPYIPFLAIALFVTWYFDDFFLLQIKVFYHI